MWGGGGCKDNQCSRQWAAWWSRQRRSFSRGRRPEIARTTRPTPVYLHRRLAGHPAPGCHCRSRTQAGAAVPRRPSQLPRFSRRGSALHLAPPGVRRWMPPQSPRSPRRRCPQGCRRRRRGRWARTRPAARNWVSKSSQGRRACGGQESVQRGGPYRRAGRRGPGSRPRRCRPVSSPPARTSRSASRSRIAGASFGRGATAMLGSVEANPDAGACVREFPGRRAESADSCVRVYQILHDRPLRSRLMILGPANVFSRKI